ncbi:hypothetical protein [Janthinobacterium sp.]|nr:hypothetical protein [Janthinobacterium sp.]
MKGLENPVEMAANHTLKKCQIINAFQSCAPAALIADGEQN